MCWLCELELLFKVRVVMLIKCKKKEGKSVGVNGWEIGGIIGMFISCYYEKIRFCLLFIVNYLLLYKVNRYCIVIC